MITGLAAHDVRLQYRSGFHAAYLFVCISYIVLLRLIPLELRALLLPPVLLSEASVVGFFFAGALLHFERGDGVLHALGVTPAGTAAYLGARTVALTVLNVAVVAAIVLGAGLFRNGGLLLYAAVLTAAFFTLLGTAVASRFAGIDRFVVLGGLVSAAFGLVVLPYFGVAESPLWRVLPTDAALRLLAAGLDTGYTAAGDVVSATLVLLAWCAGAAWLAVRWLDTYAFGRGGT